MLSFTTILPSESSMMLSITFATMLAFATTCFVIELTPWPEHIDAKGNAT
jgi:hypothetical protein